MLNTLLILKEQTSSVIFNPSSQTEKSIWHPIILLTGILGSDVFCARQARGENTPLRDEVCFHNLPQCTKKNSREAMRVQKKINFERESIAIASNVLPCESRHNSSCEIPIASGLQNSTPLHPIQHGSTNIVFRLRVVQRRKKELREKKGGAELL